MYDSITMIKVVWIYNLIKLTLLSFPVDNHVVMVVVLIKFVHTFCILKVKDRHGNVVILKKTVKWTICGENHINNKSSQIGRILKHLLKLYIKKQILYVYRIKEFSHELENNLKVLDLLI